MAVKQQGNRTSQKQGLDPIRVNVLDIYLDPQNPRHDPIERQSDIISHLVKKEKIKNLARDIAKEGISPIELLAVVRDDKENFIAVEGNRRLCALTLLNDPSLAPESDRSYFKKLAADSAAIPTNLNCIEFASREAANAWILRRHGGEQDGVGTRQWDPTQVARHKSGNDKPNYNALALSIIDYAVSEGFLQAQSRERILTTVARYLGNPYFRKTVGIVSARSDSDVVINVTYEDFDRVIQRFFQDLLKPNSSVNSRSNKDDWEAYAASLVNKGYAPGQHGSKQKLSEKGISGGGKEKSGAGGRTENADADPSGQKPASKGSTRSPDRRQYIVPSEFRPPVKNKILRRVLDEMRNIPVDDYPLAISHLTRAFLENLYSEFHAAMAFYTGGETHAVLLKVIKLIDGYNDCTKAEKQALGALRRVQSNENNVLSPKTLGANAHASHYPNGRELKREWDNVSAILEYMLRKMNP